MYHLRAGVSLLVVVCDGDRIELCHGVVATEDARGVLPCHGRPCLHLCPRELRRLSAEVSTLRDKVQHASPPLLVARVPVLHGGVFHLGTVLDDYLDDGCVKLVLVAHRGGTSLKVRHIGVVVGYDERPLELSCVACVDAEVARQLHRAAHTLRDIDERAVREDCRVEGGEEVVPIRHDTAEILTHECGVLLDGLADGHEDDTLLLQLLLECCLDRHGVHDGVDSDTAQREPLLKRDAQLVKCLHQLRVDIVGCLRRVGLLGERVGIV